MEQTTTAAGWAAKKQTKKLSLPSGAVVEVIEGSLLPYMMANILPTMLVAQATLAKQGTNTPEEMEGVAAGMKKLMVLVPQVVVSPKIILEGAPGENEIHIAKIPFADLQALIQYSMRGKEAAVLAPFPDGVDGAPAGPAVSEVPPAAVNGNGPA